VVAEQLFVQLLAVAQASELDLDSAALQGDELTGDSRILIGSPMSSTRASPGSPIAPACTTS
jgi:hypothetical protein